MDLHRLGIFTAVYRLRSFSKAAATAGLSQPTVSEHISELERELGRKLFDRAGRSVLPTDAAARLYPVVVELLEKADEIKSGAWDAGRQQGGEMRIGASNIPATYLLPPAMAAFARLHGNVTFDLAVADSAVIFERLRAHELLMGFTGTQPNDAQLSSRPFAEDELVLVAPPGFKAKKKMSLDELVRQPFIAREKGSGTRAEAERLFALQGVKTEAVNVIAVVGSNEAVRQAVRAGLGVSVLSARSVRDDALRGELTVLSLDRPLKRAFYVVTHARRTLPSLYTEFATFVIDQFAGKR